jgi:hypothetical protein
MCEDRHVPSGNETFPLMGELRVLILDSCSINIIQEDTFTNLGTASTNTTAYRARNYREVH